MHTPVASPADTHKERKGVLAMIERTRISRSQAARIVRRWRRETERLTVSEVLPRWSMIRERRYELESGPEGYGSRVVTVSRLIGCHLIKFPY